MKDTSSLQIGNISISYTGLVSRSRIRLFDGQRSWEVDIRLEQASSLQPKCATYYLGKTDWRGDKRKRYAVPAQELADWLAVVMEDDMTLIRSTRPACPESGIIRFIDRFKTRKRKKDVKADTGLHLVSERQEAANPPLLRIAA
jgi:hypothetical protein